MAGLVSCPEPRLWEPGAQLIRRVAQGWAPEAWCRAGGHLVETARTSLNIKRGTADLRAVGQHG